MIEPTAEMVTAAAEVAEDEMIRRLGRDLGTIHRDDIIRAILAAAFAIVDRDYVVERRPNFGLCCIGYGGCERLPGCSAAEPARADERADEHHYDVSCDDRPYCRIPEHHEVGVLP